MKIRHLLSLSVFATGAAGVSAMLADRTWSTREMLYERVQRRGDVIAESMGVLAIPHLKGEGAIKSSSLELFSGLPDVDYAIIHDKKGTPVFEYAPRLQRLRTADRSERLPVLYEILEKGSSLGTVRLTISMHNINTELQTIFWRGVAIGLLSLGGLALMAWLFGALLGRQLDRFVLALDGRDSALLGPLPPILKDSVLESAWGSYVKLHADLKREEELRQQAEKLKNDLTGMIVHDLKHPLTILHTVLTIIQDKNIDPAVKADVQPMRMAQRAVTRLNAMIEDVLQISRMNNSEVPLERKRLPLGEFLEESFSENRLIVEHTGRVFQEDLAPEVGKRWAFGDKQMLRRLLGNLVLNAVEHSPDGAKVTMGARTSTKDPESMDIFVHNEGDPIPKAQLGTVFEKYVSFGDSVRNVGLGLAFCRLVARNHHGRLSVESGSEGGTTFTLTLPTSRQAPEEKPFPEDPARQSGPEAES